MHKIRKRNWLIKRIALGFAVAALFAPVAQAKVDESAVVQAHTYQPVPANGYQAFVTDFPSYPAVVTGQHSWPGVDPTSGQVYPLYHVSSVVDSSTTSSFDWRYAGIGAGLVLALVLLGGGAVLATRKLSRAQTA